MQANKSADAPTRADASTAPKRTDAEASTLATEVTRTFIRTDKLHRQVVETRITDSVGLHRSQHSMLMHLSRAQTPPSQKELAAFFDISPAAVTVTLNRLEAGGYITRNTTENDNRSNRIRITDKGRLAVAQSEVLFSGIDSAMVAGLSQEQLLAFLDTLKVMQANLCTMLGSNAGRGDCRACPLTPQTERKEENN